MCISPLRCYCCNGLSSSGITRPQRYYAIVRLPVKRQLVLALLSLVPALLSSVRDFTGSPGLPYIHHIQHAIVSDPGKVMQHLPIALHYSGFHTPNGVTLSILGAFEAQSVQLSLTACCLGSPVLNLWDYSRRPRVLYPVAGLPCRNGTYTR